MTNQRHGPSPPISSQQSLNSNSAQRADSVHEDLVRISCSAYGDAPSSDFTFDPTSILGTEVKDFLLTPTGETSRTPCAIQASNIGRSCDELNKLDETK